MTPASHLDSLCCSGVRFPAVRRGKYIKPAPSKFALRGPKVPRGSDNFLVRARFVPRLAAELNRLVRLAFRLLCLLLAAAVYHDNLSSFASPGDLSDSDPDAGYSRDRRFARGGAAPGNQPVGKLSSRVG